MEDSLRGEGRNFKDSAFEKPGSFTSFEFCLGIKTWCMAAAENLLRTFSSSWFLYFLKRGKCPLWSRMAYTISCSNRFVFDIRSANGRSPETKSSGIRWSWALVPRAPVTREKLFAFIGQRVILKLLSCSHFSFGLMNLEPIYSPLLSGLVMVPGPSEKVPVTSSCGTNSRVSLPEQWNLLSLPPEAPLWLFVTWTHSPMLLSLSVIWVQPGKFSEALLLFIYFLFFL